MESVRSTPGGNGKANLVESNASPLIEISDALVIGAGPAGLAAAAALQEAGIRTVVLEKEEKVGNAWRHHYDRLHLHTVKHFSHLPYKPYPKDYPRYVSREQFVKYLEDYAKEFRIRPRFGETVLTVRMNRGKWEARTQSGVYRANYLVVASGYNHQPNMPGFPGEDHFGGTILHSSQYKNGSEFSGKKVLVVGCGNSGSEIAIDLAEHGAEPGLVIRSPIHVVPRDMNGVPNQVNAILLDHLPLSIADAIAVRILKLYNGDLTPYGIRLPEIGPNRQIKEFGRVPLLDIGTVDLIKKGRITVYPGIERLTEKGVVFVDGREKPFDALVYATGYKARLDRFLEDADKLTDSRGYPVAHGRETSMPGLFFIGFRNPTTGALREMNIEAQRVARIIGERFHRR